MVIVKEMMTKNPVRIPFHSTIRKAVDLMVEKKIGCLLVSRGDETIGILEEGDIVRKVLAKDLNPYVTKVEDAMSVPPVIDSGQSDDEASDMMITHHVRHLAVLMEGKIVGIVSMQDLVRPVYTGKSFWT